MKLGKDVRSGELLLASRPLGIAFAPPSGGETSGGAPAPEPIDLLRELAVKSFNPAQLQIIEALRAQVIVEGGTEVQLS